MRKVVSYILFLLLAAILLYFSFREVKWSDFWNELLETRYGWILLSMVFGAYASWVRGVRWRLLIRSSGYQVSKRDAFDAVNIAYLTNFALPRAGELARCGVLTKTATVPFDALLGTVVLERVFDTVCLIAIAVVVIALQWSVFGVFMEQQIWIPFLEMFHGRFIYLILILFALTLLFVLLIVFRKRFQKLLFFKKISDLSSGLFHGLKSGFTMREKTPFLSYTLLIWILYWATCWCTILAFPASEHLNYLDALFLMVVGSFGWVVPVQGGIGAYHFIVSTALVSVYGISQTQSVVFAIISHESQALAMILFGLYSLIRVGIVKNNRTIEEA